ncbi:hypothetical protein [Marinobacter sp. CA1]|uniref:hypothetical protein n=1 Tax=Marinobacter sp. CA1 TaxID=2817656 RepID=UPI001D0623A1|nr:hypothetical protein [Marinobacter sp. CA1]UDL05860.1 hypothetical protein J2887_03595 [Marinobacter sp. CA1]
MMRKIGLGVVAGGLAIGAGSSYAADFGVTADVQNTLEVTVVAPMSLGTLFVNATDGTGIGTLVLNPDGSFTPGETDQVITSLGGQSAAQASVATDQNFIVNVPTAALDASTWAAAGDVATTLLAAGAVEVRLGGTAGDPNVARLYLANFTVGDITDGVESGGPAVPGAPVTIDPDFGATAVTFGIGAEVFTDDSGTRTQYETGTYEGTFEVTAEF